MPTLTTSQLDALKQHATYPSRRYLGRDGQTHTTIAEINYFVSSILDYHRRNGYITDRQFAAIRRYLTEATPNVRPTED